MLHFGVGIWLHCCLLQVGGLTVVESCNIFCLHDWREERFWIFYCWFANITCIYTVLLFSCI